MLGWIKCMEYWGSTLPTTLPKCYWEMKYKTGGCELALNFLLTFQNQPLCETLHVTFLVSSQGPYTPRFVILHQAHLCKTKKAPLLFKIKNASKCYFALCMKRMGKQALHLAVTSH